MSGAPLRLGFVGCGRIAQAHLEAATVRDGLEVAAVVDTVPEALAATRERHSCPGYSRYDDPEFQSSIDAVVVATPPATHAEIVRHFIGNGTPVLCEKPLTVASSEAEQLVALSRKKDALLMMASKFRYVPDMIEAKAMLASGAIGRTLLLEIAFAGRVSMRHRWNSDPAVAGGGVLMDHGSHAVDIYRYFLGPIVEVQADVSSGFEGLQVEEGARLRVRNERGNPASIDLSWCFDRDDPYFVRLHGQSGAIEIGWAGSRYRLSGGTGWQSFGSGYNKVQALGRQLENFGAAIRGDEEPLITAEDAAASVAVIEAAYRSVETPWERI